MGMASLLRTILRLFKAKARGAKLLDLHDDLLREILLRIGFPADLIRASAACNTFRRLVTEPSFSRQETKRPPPALTDDLLEEIFLRVGSPADLARASTACVSFRRLINEPSFLRRYRATHPPLLLGFVCNAGLICADPPHPSYAAARSHAHAADFSFNDYLPPGRGLRWCPSDVRDGRVLLFSMPKHKEHILFGICPGLAVCDPLSRRYMLLPPIPDDLVASVQVVEQSTDSCEFLLVPSGHEELETSFRVISYTCCMTRLVVFIYSSVSGYWSVTTSPTWHSLGLNVLPPDFLELEKTQRVYGCFYWKVYKMNKLLKLDMNIMEFSVNDLPPDHADRNVVIVEGGEGKVAMFSQMIDNFTSVEYYTFLQDGNEWHMKNTITLPFNYNTHIRGPRSYGSVEGYIFLVGFLKGQETKHTAYFSLEIKTFNIERICTMRFPCGGYPYFGLPPFMSPARIQGYDEVGF
ncbi:hypothetical protein BAE44_0018564 [Dichanthelium oligosanthes]|uniref:F-box domain-containing protein n=1 Tax=Dichanthelium oligosanthes TaxID=888268 RepID=A0A1E5V5P1_9POAL|nr:hypothetical protein BAE44_0018564 [Dichanthelium oligosanthes]